MSGVTVMISHPIVLASITLRLERAVRVIPLGIAMGLIVPLMVFVHSLWLAIPLMIMIGGLAGFFVVPMNALLQHRGHNLMGAGRSIAVQNFNENISVLAMLAIYSLLIWLDLPVQYVIIGFGLAVSGIMWLVIKRHERNQAEYDSMHLIGEHKH